MLSKDTLFDYSVLESSQLLHQDIDEAGDESRQEANETADNPATDLQTTETLHTQGEEQAMFTHTVCVCVYTLNRKKTISVNMFLQLQKTLCTNVCVDNFVHSFGPSK